MTELLTREGDIGLLITERASRNATLDAVRSSIKEYQKNIESEFQGSMEELRQAILDFQSQSR